MKLTVLAALLAALSLPAAVSAQEAPQQPAVTQQQPGTQQGMPRIYKRWSRMLSGVNLSNDQHDRIQNLIDQYAQAHPAGSQKDPGAARQLHDQIFAILTPDQQTQVQQHVAQMRQERQARQAQLRQERAQQPQQQYPQPNSTP